MSKTSLRRKVKNKLRRPDYYVDKTKKNADTDDIIQMILYADQHKITASDTVEVAKEFKGRNVRETCRKVWQFVRKNIDYKRDKKFKERVKSPSVTFFDGYADCKSMSLWVASILKNLGIRYLYRFTGYDNDKWVTHVYVIAFDEAGKPIIIDATYDRFDAEVKPKFKKDKMPTEVAFIHTNATRKARNTRGRGGYDFPAVAANEMADRSKEVSKKSPINYSLLTAGEMQLVIADERLKLYAQFYPEMAHIYNKGRQLINGFLQKGVHVAPTHFGGIVEPELYPLLNKIKQAKRKTRPAGGMLFGKSRRSISRGIGQDLIEQLDCQALYPIYPALGVYIPSNVAMQNQCAAENIRRARLNEHWEEVSPHVLYEFLNSEHLQGLNNYYSGIVSNKQYGHNLGVEVISDISQFDRETLREWTRLGILRQNAAGEAGLIEPEDAIWSMRENPDAPGVGWAIEVTLAVLAIVAAAISAAATMYASHQATERSKIDAEVKGWASAAYSAQNTDWPSNSGGGSNQNSGGNTGSQSSNGNTGSSLLSGNTPLIIGGGALAAFLLLDD